MKTTHYSICLPYILDSIAEEHRDAFCEGLGDMIGYTVRCLGADVLTPIFEKYFDQSKDQEATSWALFYTGKKPTISEIRKIFEDGMVFDD